MFILIVMYNRNIFALLSSPKAQADASPSPSQPQEQADVGSAPTADLPEDIWQLLPFTTAKSMA